MPKRTASEQGGNTSKAARTCSPDPINRSAVRICSADFCKHTNLTHQQVLIPYVTTKARQKAEVSDDTAKLEKVSSADKCRKVQLKALWHNPSQNAIDNAVADGRRLQVCIDHYPPGSIGQHGRGYFLKHDAVPYTFEKFKEALRLKEQHLANDLKDRSERCQRRIGRQDIRDADSTEDEEEDHAAKLAQRDEEIAQLRAKLDEERRANVAFEAIREELDKEKRARLAAELGGRDVREQYERLKSRCVQKLSMNWVLEDDCEMSTIHWVSKQRGCRFIIFQHKKSRTLGPGFYRGLLRMWLAQAMGSPRA